MQLLSAVEFMRGLVSQLAADNYSVIPYEDKRKFHGAMIELSDWLHRKASAFGVEPNFHYANNQGGFSFAVKSALLALSQEELLLPLGRSWVALLYNTDQSYAKRVVSKTPGGMGLYRAAEQEFLKLYPFEPVMEKKAKKEVG